MLYFDSKLYKNFLPSQGKLICLDVGTKRIGIATCDETQNFITPKLILNRQNQNADFAKIAQFIDENAVKAIIIGFPMHMDEKEVEMSQFVRDFGQHLDVFFTQNNKNFDIFFHDERLSTFEAKELAKEIPSRKKQKHVDDLAAYIILEDFLTKFKAT